LTESKLDIPQNWTFKSGNIAENFDAHVREQLPWYDMATAAVAHIARHYMPEGGTVYDLGASTGNMGRALLDTINARAIKFIPVECSAEMASKYDGPGSVVVEDVTALDFEPFDVAIMFLSLMFVKVSDRDGLIKKLLSSCRNGGAIIILDKVVLKSGYISTIMHRLTMSCKLGKGVSGDDILKKELSISGVQRPLKDSYLGYICPNATEFFRFGEFVGWIVEVNE
jgi:tRNA (cmo5U34)-methyltransferase